MLDDIEAATRDLTESAEGIVGNGGTSESTTPENDETES